MEWLTEKILQIIPMLLLGGWTVYVFRQNRKDKQADANREISAVSTSAIVADGTTLRKDLREMLKDEQNRSDKIEEWLRAAQKDISALQIQVNNLLNTKTLLEQEKGALTEQKETLEQEVKDLRGRVLELEREVRELITGR